MNSSEALWKIQTEIPSVIPFVIDMINSVHSLPMNLPTDFTDRTYSVSNSVVKNDTSSFFLLCFNFFSTVISSVYTEGIFPSVNPSKIYRWKYSLNIFVCIYRFWGSEVKDTVGVKKGEGKRQWGDCKK